MNFYKNLSSFVGESLEELHLLFIATQKLGLPVETKSICFYFYHRMQFIDTDYSKFTRIITVLNLSMKINENVKKFKEIFQIITEILQEKPDFTKTKDEMMVLEVLLQENTGFVEEFNSPFRFLTCLVKDLNLSRDIGKKSWKITLFSLFTPLCIQIVPHAIAFSCISISIILSGEKVNLIPEKYFISQDQVVKGVKNVLQLLLNQKFQEMFNVGEDQDFIREILNSIDKNGNRLLMNPVGISQSQFGYPQQNTPDAQQSFHSQNKGYGQRGYNSHEGSGDRRNARFSMTMKCKIILLKKDDKRNFTPAQGMGFMGPSTAAASHAGDRGYRQASSIPPGYMGHPENRRNSDQHESRKSTVRDFDDKRKRHSSAESYSDEVYERDGDYNRDRDHQRDRDYDRRRDHYDRDYERRSGHRDRKMYNRQSYDQGSFRHDSSRNRTDSRYPRDDWHSKTRRDGSSYQNQSSYYSKR